MFSLILFKVLCIITASFNDLIRIMKYFIKNLKNNKYLSISGNIVVYISDKSLSQSYRSFKNASDFISDESLDINHIIVDENNFPV